MNDAKYDELCQVFFDIEASDLSTSDQIKAIAIVRESYHEDAEALKLGAWWIYSVLENK